MASQRIEVLLKILHKIPMFSGLQAPHIKQVLSLCRFRTVPAEKVLFRAGDRSTDMFILLRGRLRVLGAERVVLASIEPAAPVGEMGMITGQARSATVETVDPCHLLVLEKSAFDRLMRSSPQVCLQVYGHVIGMLARRLRDTEEQHVAARSACVERRRILEERLNRLHKVQIQR